MPSPIEQMIDKATGYKPEARPSVKWSPVNCDACGNHRRVLIAATKPFRVLCRRCLTKKGKP